MDCGRVMPRVTKQICEFFGKILVDLELHAVVARRGIISSTAASSAA
jgi:hypothetical protein